ncbi:bifunctional pirin family protein/GNAT family N-acetyltransferase [Glycomyces luteolus]|uniref:Bifunctional pirin family protein/GNAT family N-acetyltransferase n=1 Tax=Glycomyces luteolus TaxID=2670330 RepID=A0A9X3P8W6_9ACTN|nr:bifunctional pirin family protein/GNAT family N-acetyltransferase [Glycomyces luteolus]MDA1360966.1 bifunctional pirin family protein/GNAT family N-acetyltransferase [Glycomyces luteolus]
MSNVEAAPEAMQCAAEADGATGVEVLTPREVPLGGPRALEVRRTLPQRARTLIGAWCFADHYGPVRVPATGGMDVPPHPHTGLQTVSWLFAGEVEHRDTLGSHAIIRPGELNLMTGGLGIAHSEVSTPDTAVLHGVQLWVALPEADRDAGRDFQHHVPEPVRLDGAEIRVFLGSLAGDTSPVRTYTPLLGAQVDLEPHAAITLDVDAGSEHGLLVDSGEIRLGGTVIRPAELGYLASGVEVLTLSNCSDEPARAILLGGPPFEEEIVMWWNFIGRSHDDIVQAREDWEAGSDRFGTVEGYPGRRLPAPPLPNAVIMPRRNPPARERAEAPGEPVVRRVDAERLYEIAVDGVRAGLTAYRDRGNQRIFYHTEVDKAFARKGLASALVEEALADTRAAGKRTVPVCPYVARFIKKHSEFDDVADPVAAELLQWLEVELASQG